MEINALTTLADAGLDEDQVQLLIYGCIAGGISLLISGLNGVLNLIKFFRPSPPNHQQYATKEEVKALRGELRSDFTKLEAANANNFKEIFESLRSIERSLGRLEGKDQTRPL